MQPKYRSTIIRRHKQDTFSDDENYSDASSFIGDEESYFPPKKLPIAPVFPFSLASSLHMEFRRAENTHDKIQTCHNDNIIRLDSSLMLTNDSGWNASIEETLQLLNQKIAIRKWKHIQHLAISCNWWKTTPPISERQEWKCMIADITKSFPSVQYLHLNFEECNKARTFGNKELTWLSFHITTFMYNLKHLFIKFFQDFLVTADTFGRFCSQIGKRSKRLESLTLDFSRCEQIEPDFFKSLTHFATSYLRHLKDFRIIYQDVPDSALRTVCFDKRRYLKQLESFDLYMSGPQLFRRLSVPMDRKMVAKNSKQLTLDFFPFINSGEKNGLDYFALNCLKYLQNLKILNICFERLDVDLEAAQAFIKTLSNINSLEKMKFQSTNGGLMTENFLKLFQFPEKNQLKKLRMRFIAKQGRFSVESFSIFILNSMKNLKSLTHLDLFFETVDIKTEQVKLLTSCIAKNLSALEFISIQFFLCSEITGDAIEAFQTDLCSENALPNLKILLLNFSSCDHQITQKQIDTLKGQLQKKLNIESLTVYFVDNNTDSEYEKPEDAGDPDGFETRSQCSDCRDLESAAEERGVYNSSYPIVCRAHQRESDNSDENLSDFLEEDDDDF